MQYECVCEWVSVLVMRYGFAFSVFFYHVFIICEQNHMKSDTIKINGSTSQLAKRQTDSSIDNCSLQHFILAMEYSNQMMNIFRCLLFSQRWCLLGDGKQKRKKNNLYWKLWKCNSKNVHSICVQLLHSHYYLFIWYFF